MMTDDQEFGEHVDERTLAATPTTSAATLQQLARLPDAAVRALVAANPNTPAATLSNVATQFPREFLANPVLPLLLLADPSYPATFPAETLFQLLRFAPVPAAFLSAAQALCSKKTVIHGLQGAVQHHIGVAGEAPSGWITELPLDFASEWDRLHDRGWTTLPDFLPPGFVALGQTHIHLPYVHSATPAAATPTRLSSRQREHLAKDCQTPHEVLWSLAQDARESVRLGVANNSASPPAVLAQLAQDDAVAVCCAVAKNARSAPDVLALLAHEAAPKIRVAVAHNTATVHETLDLLSHDPEIAVRRALAGNPRLSVLLLARLATDLVAEVRWAVTGHRHLPPGLRAQLASDADVMVRQSALRQTAPEVTSEHWVHQKRDVVAYQALAANRHTSIIILRHLAFDYDARVRAAVAANRATPVDLLPELALDAAHLVRLAVARNPHTPFVVLERMMGRRPPAEICHALVHHPSVSRARRQMLYEIFLTAHHHVIPTARRRQEVTLQRLGLAVLRQQTAILLKGSQSIYWNDRFMVAMNPHAPRDIHEALAHDGNRYVRAAARQSLAQNETLDNDQPAAGRDRDTI